MALGKTVKAALERAELNAKLSAIEGIRGVYFNPPPSLMMEYPAIRYNQSNDTHSHADNILYFRRKRYTVTLIYRNPDCGLPDALLGSFPYCSLDRMYTMDGLHHAVFTLYY